MGFVSFSSQDNDLSLNSNQDSVELIDENFVRGSCTVEIDGQEVTIFTGCFLCGETKANERACRKANELKDQTTIQPKPGCLCE